MYNYYDETKFKQDNTKSTVFYKLYDYEQDVELSLPIMAVTEMYITSAHLLGINVIADILKALIPHSIKCGFTTEEIDMYLIQPITNSRFRCLSPLHNETIKEIVYSEIAKSDIVLPNISLVIENSIITEMFDNDVFVNELLDLLLTKRFTCMNIRTMPVLICDTFIERNDFIVDDGKMLNYINKLIILSETNRTVSTNWLRGNEEIMYLIPANVSNEFMRSREFEMNLSSAIARYIINSCNYSKGVDILKNMKIYDTLKMMVYVDIFKAIVEDDIKGFFIDELMEYVVSCIETNYKEISAPDLVQRIKDYVLHSNFFYHIETFDLGDLSRMSYIIRICNVPMISISDDSTKKILMAITKGLPLSIWKNGILKTLEKIFTNDFLTSRTTIKAILYATSAALIKHTTVNDKENVVFSFDKKLMSFLKKNKSHMNSITKQSEMGDHYRDVIYNLSSTHFIDFMVYMSLCGIVNFNKFEKKDLLKIYNSNAFNAKHLEDALDPSLYLEICNL